MAGTFNDGILLSGLDGSNPLAFLATLGVLRTLDCAWPDRPVRLSWVARTAWQPVLYAADLSGQDELVDALDAHLKEAHGYAAFADLGKNLSVHPDHFRELAGRAADAAALDQRAGADFLAAFGNEVTCSEKGDTIQDTAFRTMGGAGHQHFLEFMRNFVAATTPDHLRKSLFDPWRYDDPVEKQTMRWDPADDTRYALQWRNPSGDPLRKKRGSMIGANRLAIEALPLFTTAPTGTRLRTTGFTGRTSRSTFWTWPIWSGRATCSVVRSLVAMAQLQEEKPPRDQLVSLGVVEIYRVQRLTIGKLRNFSPAKSV